MAMETDRHVDKYGNRRQTDRLKNIDTSYRDTEWQICLQATERQADKHGYGDRQTIEKYGYSRQTDWQILIQATEILTDKYGYKLQKNRLTHMVTSDRQRPRLTIWIIQAIETQTWQIWLQDTERLADIELRQEKCFVYARHAEPGARHNRNRNSLNL